MSETTIQWTATKGPDGRFHAGFSHNAWVGCREVDPDPEHPGGPSECDNCYARNGSRRLGAQHGLQLWPGEPGGAHDIFFTGEDYQRKPFAWNRKAEKLGVRLKVFAASYSDICERRDDLVDRRQLLARTIIETPWLDWLLLTKRPEDYVELFSPTWPGEWPTNVWAGTTVGLRPSLKRLEFLKKVPARTRFLSMEPLLEDVGVFDAPAPDDTGPFGPGWIKEGHRTETDCGPEYDFSLTPGVDQVIIGGESGSRARPFRIEWARKLIKQCRDAGVATFVKQLGAHVLWDGMSGPGEHWPESTRTEPAGDGSWRVRLKDSHGGDWDEWPEDLRVREFPEAA